MYSKGRGREISTVESFDFYEGQSINQSVCQTVKQSLRRSTNQVINSQMKTQKVSTSTFFLLRSLIFVIFSVQMFRTIFLSMWQQPHYPNRGLPVRCTYVLPQNNNWIIFLDKFYILSVLLKLQGFISDLWCQIW